MLSNRFVNASARLYERVSDRLQSSLCQNAWELHRIGDRFRQAWCVPLLCVLHLTRCVGNQLSHPTAADGVLVIC